MGPFGGRTGGGWDPDLQSTKNKLAPSNPRAQCYKGDGPLLRGVTLAGSKGQCICTLKHEGKGTGETEVESRSRATVEEPLGSQN